MPRKTAPYTTVEDWVNPASMRPRPDAAENPTAPDRCRSMNKLQ